jgi:hypothetical protein
MANELVSNYTMLQSEKRLLALSPLFLINSRESSLITAQLTAIALRMIFVSNSELYKIMANPD